MSIAEALVDIMVDHANDEGRDLDAHEFAFRTSKLSPAEADEVFRALPLWAQRRVEATAPQLEAGMLPK